MRQIVVISGKGGTGKTVLTSSFASLARNKVMVDCDVDAADLHIILKPKIKERYIFRSGYTAEIDSSKCTGCGNCLRYCRFGAVSREFSIDALSCEGCGLCSRICPSGAINMEERVCGEWFISDTGYGKMVHAKLGIAQENSGKLVAKIKRAAKEIAEAEGCGHIIVDGPPGIGCPVIASLSGADLAVIVTEPTLSGIHDLKRVLELTGHFKIEAGVVVNKYDINIRNLQEIESFCLENDIGLLGHIPFSSEVSRSIVKRIPAVDHMKNDVSSEIRAIWEKIENR
ncbi:MAG: ATP-binding protein [Candidatus Omnitrophica bacterium]|nr:ATP-binding protein [Candidatus Omnitrophota bacterium]MDD5736942.1 ATP-binding protein [Candidatus Omnitrophota bacterium]